MNKTILIAVYGTLRKGFSNHPYMSKASFIGKGKTKDLYTLTASGIPFVSKNPRVQVTVEIYELPMNELIFVDRLEGHPDFYCREEIDCILDTKEQRKAWLYFCENVGNTLIETGDYSDYKKQLLNES